MQKLLIVVSLLAMTVPAVAHERHYVPLPPRRPHSIMPWVAGGLAIGALGGMYYHNHRHDCWSQMVGYDEFGRKLWETVCR